MEPAHNNYMNKAACRNMIDSFKADWKKNTDQNQLKANAVILKDIISSPYIDPAKKPKIVYAFLLEQKVAPDGEIAHFKFLDDAFKANFSVTQKEFCETMMLRTSHKEKTKVIEELKAKISNKSITNEDLFDHFLSTDTGHLLKYVKYDLINTGREDFLMEFGLILDEDIFVLDEPLEMPPSITASSLSQVVQDQSPVAEIHEEIESPDEKMNFTKVLKSLADNIEKKAPETRHFLKITHNGVDYRLWWNPKLKSFNIQTPAGWEKGLHTGKIAVCLPNAGPQYYVDGNPAQRISKEQETLLRDLEGIFAASVQQYKDLDKLSDITKKLAPNAKSPFNFRVNGEEYKVWWSDFGNATNIQKKANFLSTDPIICQQEKLGYKILPDEKIQCYVNGKPSQNTVNKEQYDLVLALLPQADTLNTKLNELANAEKKLKPELLILLKSFLASPKGADYAYKPPATESKKVLDLGGNPPLCAWMKIEPVRDRFTNFIYHLNIQNTNDYEFGSQDNKLGIEMNDHQRVLSLFCEGIDSQPSEVFQANSIWSSKLNSTFDNFLMKQAIQSDYSGYIRVHPLAIAQLPGVVLKKLCSGNTFEVLDAKFFNSNLEVEPAQDVGGPTRQLMSLLSRALVQVPSLGTSLPMHKAFQVPMLTKPEDEEILLNFGKLLAACIKDQRDLITGRILPNNYFDLFKSCFSVTEQLISDDVMMILLPDILMRDEDKWMYDIWKTGRPVSENEKVTLVNVLMLEDENGDELDTTNKTKVKKALQDSLLADYGPIIQGARIVAIGAKKAGVSDNRISGFIGSPSTYSWARGKPILSTKIQGNEFSREDIASRVKTSSTHPVVLEKVQWLKELIRDQPEEWVLKLLETMTGERAVAGSTVLTFHETGGLGCVAHTCFKSMDLPIEHTDIATPQPSPGTIITNKQKFIDNLSLTLATKGFDAR